MATIANNAQTRTVSSDLVRQLVTVASLLVTLAVNALANILPINGQTTAAVSDSFPVYFVPAGYVFSIWGIIYIALTAFTVYQVLPSQAANPTLRRLGFLPALSGLVNSVWIFLWHYELFVGTLVAMLGLLATLLVIYVRLAGSRLTGGDRWLVQLPFSIYLGWITVATIANATDVLYDLGWQDTGTGGQFWAAALLVVGTLITAGLLATRRDLAYAMVIIWAFVGIYVKQGDAPLVAYTAVGCAVVVAVLAVAAVIFRRPRQAKMAAGSTA